MPPSRKKEKGHAWTKFEIHTMLCLILKGVHLTHPTKTKTKKSSSSNTTTTSRRHAYDTFASQLNLSLHGKDYSQDIPKHEIIAMLEQLLQDRKHVIGSDKLSLHMRSPHARVTRNMVTAFDRARGLDFDGSLGEWRGGRGARVLKVEREMEGALRERRRVEEEKRREERRFWRR